MVKYTDYNAALENLENWLTSQSHLPVIKKHVLEHFIHAAEGDLEVVKNKIDLQYYMRNNWPDLFIERDPNAKMTLNIYDVVDIVDLPGKTPEGWKIIIMRLADFNPDKFNAHEALKLFLMLFDARINNFDKEEIPKGEQILFDAKGFTLKHLAKISLTVVRVFTKFNEEAAPIKIRDIHVLNCPPFLDKILAVFKPFLSTEIYQMIKFHQPNSDTLSKYVTAKNMLLKDYGGTVDIAERKQEIQKTLLNDRDYLMDKTYWVTDEKKRPANQPKPLALEGNFKSLNVD